VQKWLWNRLNELRVRMVMKRRSARIINRISKICVRIWRDEYAD